MEKKIFENIKKLRQITKISIVECKKILIESNNNLQLSINKIKQNYNIINNNININNKMILLYISKNRKKHILIEVKYKTDFVAMQNEIQKYLHLVINIILKYNLKDIKKLYHNNIFKLQTNNLINKYKEEIIINKIYFKHTKYNYIGYTYTNNNIGKIGIICDIKGYNLKLIDDIIIHIISNKFIFFSYNLLQYYLIKNSNNQYLLLKKKINKLKKIILLCQKFVKNEKYKLKNIIKKKIYFNYIKKTSKNL